MRVKASLPSVLSSVADTTHLFLGAGAGGGGGGFGAILAAWLSVCVCRCVDRLVSAFLPHNPIHQITRQAARKKAVSDG